MWCKRSAPIQMTVPIRKRGPLSQAYGSQQPWVLSFFPQLKQSASQPLKTHDDSWHLSLAWLWLQLLCWQIQRFVPPQKQFGFIAWSAGPPGKKGHTVTIQSWSKHGQVLTWFWVAGWILSKNTRKFQPWKDLISPCVNQCQNPSLIDCGVFSVETLQNEAIERQEAASRLAFRQEVFHGELGHLQRRQHRPPT